MKGEKLTGRDTEWYYQSDTMVMPKEYKKKYDFIASAEEDFARAVALGVLIKRPLTAWHFLLPGMFIFDFIRRSSAIKRYSTLFMFPRKLALDVALDITEGEDRKNRVVQAEREISEWLTSLKLYSGRLHQGHIDEINLFIDHYSKLLNAEGNTYHALVKNAYKNRGNYEAFLNQLSSAEKEVDQAIAEIRGETKDIWKRLQAEQVQVEELRKKEIENIFSRKR
jgi:hypothetical protein